MATPPRSIGRPRNKAVTRFQDLDYCDKDQVAGCESCYGGTPATIGSEEYSSALMVRAKCCIVFPCRISGFRLSLKNARNRLKDRRLINQKLRIAVGSCLYTWSACWRLTNSLNPSFSTHQRECPIGTTALAFARCGDNVVIHIQVVVSISTALSN